tara:strand:+ start:864 stop:1322 length:459 start_codon:yes stop_codon:yes gene_type:complete
MQKPSPALLSIGEVAARTGLAVSAIRYYEDEGLIAARRSPGGRRLFIRSDIRRVSFIMVAQKLGFSLEDIRERLTALPLERTPNKNDWAIIAENFRSHLNERIAMLERMRDNLEGCIGCGCLSMDRCALYNPEDKAAATGTGPRFVLAKKPD